MSLYLLKYCLRLNEPLPSKMHVELLSGGIQGFVEYDHLKGDLVVDWIPTLLQEWGSGVETFLLVQWAM